MSLFKRTPNALEVTPADAHTLVADGKAVLVDVREPNEWANGHASAAKHVPLGWLAAKSAQLPKDREILVICQSGNRSLTGARWLNDAGFQARSVAGGTAAWARAGLPLGR